MKFLWCGKKRPVLIFIPKVMPDPVSCDEKNDLGKGIIVERAETPINWRQTKAKRSVENERQGD